MPTDVRMFGGHVVDAMEWNPLPHMEEWLLEKEAGEVKAGYLRTAKVGLAHFAIYARAEGIAHPDEIRRHHLLTYQKYLTTLRNARTGEPLALTYRQQLMKYLRSWLIWCDNLDYLDEMPWVRIKIGRSSKKPNPLEEEEIAALFAAHRHQAFSLHPFYYHRREVILVLLYGWGLRLMEVQGLSVEGMDARLDWVVVRNKSHAGAVNEEKVLPYSEVIKQTVLRYLQHRPYKAMLGEDALLIDSSGKPMSQQMIRSTLYDLGDRAGVKINPHRLRDTFGTTMLDADVPVERIQKMMGHTKREQTLAYSRVSDPAVKRSHGQVMDPLLTTLLNGRDLP